MMSLAFGTFSEFGISAVEFGLTWWLQSAILLLIGLLAAGWLRRRGPAAESMIYRVTLVAVLVSPLATPLLLLSGISLLNIDVQSRLASPATGEDSAASAWLTSSEDSVQSAPLLAQGEPGAVATYPADATSTRFSQVDGLMPADSVAHTTTRADDSEVSITPAPDEAMPRNHAGVMAATTALALWVVGALGFAARLILDVVRTEMLRRRSVRGDALAQEVCRDVASRLGVRSPQVLASPFLNSPCLLGHWRPAVLLPEETPATTYHEVFLHELAHLRRGDWLWNLLGYIARAMLWCQPLLWGLLRRNTVAAEEVCDDYVLQFGGSREGYLRQLVEIAQRTLPEPAMASVAMVSFQSALGGRVQRIVDTTRVLSTSTGRWFAGVSLLAMLLLTTSVGLIYVGQPLVAVGEEHNQADATAGEGQGATDDQSDLVEVSGIVLGPDGKPAPGAQVLAMRWLWAAGEAKVPLGRALTDRGGRFTVSFRKSQINRNIGQMDQWKNTSVIAVKSGSGPDAVSWRDLKDPADTTLRLAADDVPVEGEVVDLEGQPVAGVQVKVVGISKAKDNDLTPWIDAKKNGEDAYHAYRHLAGSVPEFDGFPQTKTDEQGRFQLRGLGHERVVHIVLEGPTIARTSFQVMTRPHDPITRTEGKYFAETVTTYGAKFRRTVSPTQVIRGVVRDAETRQPLAGVRMESWVFAGTRLAANRVLQTQSNADGSYELVGMPKGQGNVILANPQDGQPYLMREMDVPNPVGLGPVTVDIDLHRGVMIRGRITDKKTGEPVVARLHYLPFLENEFAQATPEFDEHGNTDGFQTRYESKPDGSFELVGLPGRAIVGVECIGRPYRTGVGVEKIEGRNEHGHYQTYNNPIIPSEKWPNTLVEINPEPDATSIDLEVQLDPGESLRISVADEAGTPLTDVDTSGLVPRGYEGEQAEASFLAIALSPDETRTIILHHKQRNLGQVIRVKADEKRRHVTLQPCATVQGQLVDSDGDPIVGVGIRVDLKPSGDFSRRLEPMTTDAEGRFLHRSIIPGTEYGLYAQGAAIGFKAVARKLEVKPGQAIDLGTLKLEGDEFVATGKAKVVPAEDSGQPVDAKAKQASGPGRRMQDRRPVTLASTSVARGRVTDPQGKPVASASILVIKETFGPMGPTGRTVTARATSDIHGKFRVPVATRTSMEDARLGGSTNILARKDGFGMGWQLIRPNAELDDVSIQLSAQKLIHGRLVDLEGQPLPGVMVRVIGLAAKRRGVELDAWHAKAKKNSAKVDMSFYLYAGQRQQPFVAFPSAASVSLQGVTEAAVAVTTQDDGTFTMSEIGEDQRVTLSVAGAGVATTFIGLVARDMEAVNMPTPDPRFATQKLYGAVFSYAAPRSRPVRGVVIDKTTRQPLSGVFVEVSQYGGSSLNVSGTEHAYTDNRGRFELTGLPARNGHVLAVQPGKQPYFRRRLQVPDGAALAPVEMTIQLQRGQWIHGSLTDGQTQKPITEGWVSYYPFLSNKHAEAYENFDAGRMSVGYANRDPIHDDGTYRVLGIPGRGIVVAGAKNGAIFQTQAGTDQIKGLYAPRNNDPKRMRLAVYHLIGLHDVHAVGEVNLLAQDEPARCNLVLQPYQRRQLAVLDDQGKPLTGFRATGHLPGDPNARNPLLGDAPKRSEPRFDVFGLNNGIPRTVSLRHDQKNIGLVTTLTDKQAPDELRLLPCGTIRGQVLDVDGSPAKGATAQLTVKTQRKSWNHFGSPSMEKQASEDDIMYLGSTPVREDGTFQFQAVPPGTAYQIAVYGQQGQILNTKTPRVIPGATIQLGKLRQTPTKREPPAGSSAA